MAEQQRGRGRASLVSFLMLTGLLVALCAWLAYQGTGRAAPVHERVVQAPPAQPTDAQRAAAAKALLETGTLEERLRTLLASLDPFQCPAGTVADGQKLAQLRSEEQANFDKWQALLKETAVSP